jgi:hypothetical protein
MWARIARFEGNPEDVDDRLARLQAFVDGGLPPELEEAKMLTLVDRETGAMLGITLFDSEDALRKADTVMQGGKGHAGKRSAVEIYEVGIARL